MSDQFCPVLMLTNVKYRQDLKKDNGPTHLEMYILSGDRRQKGYP